MLRNRLVHLILLLMLVFKGETSRILAVFGTPSISHQITFRPLTQELVARGHDVTVITPDPAYPKGKTPKNLTEIDIHDTSYKIWRRAVINPGQMTGEKQRTYDLNSAVYIMFAEMVKQQIMSAEIQEVIQDKTKQFDLILTEGYMWFYICLSHIYKVPVLMVSSFGPANMNLKISGSPRHPIYYPAFLQQDVYDHTLWQQVEEFRNFYFMNSFYENHDRLADQILRQVFGQDFPTIDELKENVGIFFSNTHPIWDMNRPVAKNIINTGAVHLSSQKVLPMDLKQYLDSSKNGVIYISFGTNADASMFPTERLQLLLNVFSKLPYDILWKWNHDELPGRSQNIRISKWLPQADLLKHPKIKLFITQGGLQSTDESIDAGVPMICIPILADQWFNAQQMVKHGIGVQLALDEMTEEQLSKHIHTLIADKTYRQNVVKLRSMFNDQPQTAKDRAIWWIEHVLRHGGSTHLRPPAANMHWVQYFEIELLFYILFTSFVLLAMSLFVVCHLFKTVLRATIR